MIWVPFSLILMGGQVLASGRTKSVFIATMVAFCENWSTTETAVGNADCWNWVGRRHFGCVRSCTSGLAFECRGRILRDSAFTAVSIFIPFLVLEIRLAQCLHALRIFFEKQGYTEIFSIFNSLKLACHSHLVEVRRRWAMFYRMKCSWSGCLLHLVEWTRQLFIYPLKWFTLKIFSFLAQIFSLVFFLVTRLGVLCGRWGGLVFRPAFVCHGFVSQTSNWEFSALWILFQITFISK